MNEEPGDFVWVDCDSPNEWTFFGVGLMLFGWAWSGSSGFEDGNEIDFDGFGDRLRAKFFEVWHWAESPLSDLIFGWGGVFLTEFQAAVGNIEVGIFFQSNYNVSTFIVEQSSDGLLNRV